MKKLLFSALIIFLSLQLYAQNDRASLMVQSPDGRTVKLVWLIKNWSPDITGFDVKRKEGLQDWVKLNSVPILPGISVKKKLAIVEADKTEASRVKDLLYDLLAAHKLKEITTDTFLQLMNSDDKAVVETAKMIAENYDAALISGFGYVDHTVTNKTDYQYGLFIHGTSKLLARAVWNYGEIPDLNMVGDITSKATAGKKGVLIIWNADVNKIKSGDVTGFNIYRQGIRLNDDPIVSVNSKDPSEFVWFDKSAGSGDLSQYSISAESLFGIEGIIKSYTYNPADHPHAYKRAEVTSITSIGYYFKEGINVQWTMPKDYERFIKYLYVEKDNMPEGYTTVSPPLDPATRVFIDHSGSPVTSYIRFRVMAVYNDKTVITGREKIYNYFPIREPPKPLNVRAKSALDDKKFTVTLTWDPPIYGDSVTDCYRVRIWDVMNNKFTTVADRLPVKAQPSYKYVTQPGSAATYLFIVTSINKARIESGASDTCKVLTPISSLPEPELSVQNFDNQDNIVMWKYPDMPDLKGFRLFQNRVMVAGNNELKREARKFITHKPSQGETFEYTVRAEFGNGALSEPSDPVSVTGEEK